MMERIPRTFVNDVARRGGKNPSIRGMEIETFEHRRKLLLRSVFARRKGINIIVGGYECVCGNPNPSMHER